MKLIMDSGNEYTLREVKHNIFIVAGEQQNLKLKTDFTPILPHINIKPADYKYPAIKINGKFYAAF